MKSGDTIALTETGAPDSTFSIIDVSRPSQPKFAGTGKSGAAAIIPYNGYSITPFAYSKGDYLFAAIGNALWCFKYHSGTLNSLSHIDRGRVFFPPSGFLSDSILIVSSWATDSCTPCFPNSHLWANELLFRNGILTFLKDKLLYQYSCGFPTGCGFETNLRNGAVYQGRQYTEFHPTGFGDAIVVDFNYPIPPELLVNEGPDLFGYQSVDLLDLSLLGDGFSIAPPGLGFKEAVMVDTAKNLVFALSDTELSIYNCKIATSVSNAPPVLAHVLHGLHIVKGKDGSVIRIYLPHHTQPCKISIFDISGKRITNVEEIGGETLAWPNQNRSGVFIVMATIDGSVITAKVVLTK